MAKNHLPVIVKFVNYLILPKYPLTVAVISSFIDFVIVLKSTEKMELN